MRLDGVEVLLEGSVGESPEEHGDEFALVIVCLDATKLGLSRPVEHNKKSIRSENGLIFL